MVQIDLTPVLTFGRVEVIQTNGMALWLPVELPSLLARPELLSHLRKPTH